MARETILKLNSKKFEQSREDTLELSGFTNQFGGITFQTGSVLLFQSGSTLSILDNKGDGNILVSDSDGLISLKENKFLNLSDTPESYIDKSNMLLKVNPTENDIVFTKFSDEAINLFPFGQEGEVYFIDKDNSNETNSDFIVSEAIVVETDKELVEAKGYITSFEEIFNTWDMFSHWYPQDVYNYNEFNFTPPKFPALDPDNTYAPLTQVMWDDRKGVDGIWRYDSTTDSIKNNANYNTYTGFYSPDKYDKYSLEVDLSSNAADDDTLTVVIGFIKDPETGFEYTLSVTRDYENTDYSYAIVYNYRQNRNGDKYTNNYNPLYEDSTEKILVNGKSKVVTSGQDWNFAGKTKIRVVRDGDLITVVIGNQGSENFNNNTTITYNLNDDPSTLRFRGACSFGFGSQSQTNATLSNLKFDRYGNYIFHIKNGGEEHDTWEYDETNEDWILQTPQTLTLQQHVGIGRIINSKNFGKLFYVNYNGNIDRLGAIAGTTGLVGDSENITKTITQSNHGFSLMDVVGWSGGTYNKAIADGTYNGEIVGVVSKIVDGNIFDLTQAGYIKTFEGLTVNATHFLSATEYGKLQTFKPTGDTQLVKSVVVADSPTSGWVLPHIGYTIKVVEDNITKLIYQENHGFSVNDVVGWNNGLYDKAIADDLYTGEAIGIVSVVQDNNYFYVTQSGYVKGLTGLIPNTTYFLSDGVAGGMQTTKPTTIGYMIKAIIVADTTESGWVLPYIGHVIETSDFTGARNFIDLGDVPNTYDDSIGRFLRVNEDGTGIVFSDSPTTISENITKTITQNNHGFSFMDVVGWSNGSYNKAIANGTYDGEVIGVVTNLINSNTFTLTTVGYVTNLTNLIPNSTYYLSNVNAGKLISTPPNVEGHIVKTVLIANTNTSAWILPYVGYVIDVVDGLTVIAFTGLTDTPSVYDNGKFLMSSGDSIVYVDAPSGIDSFTGLTDTPDVYDNGKFLMSSGDSIVYVDAPSGGEVIEVTYDALTLLINNQELVSGSRYLITDFKTVHYIPNTSNVINEGTLEPLIVTATSNETLDKVAMSPLYPQDIIHYDYNPENWLNDEGFGDNTDVVLGFKGVIYFRHDTVNDNYVDYDFRNVKFRRWNAVNNTNSKFDGIDFTNDEVWSSVYMLSDSRYAADDIDFIDVLTFNCIEGEENAEVYGNHLGNNIDSGLLSNSVFHILDVCISNTIGNYFNSNTLGNEFSYNTIGNGFMSNTIGNDFNSNTIGNSLYSSTVGNYFESNTIGNEFAYNTIGNDFYSNTIGNNFYSNTIGNDFYSNTIENEFYSNTIGNEFESNTIGNYFNSNEIGDDFYSNTIGNDFDSNTIGNEFYSNSFENNIQNVSDFTDPMYTDMYSSLTYVDIDNTIKVKRVWEGGSSGGWEDDIDGINIKPSGDKGLKLYNDLEMMPKYERVSLSNVIYTFSEREMYGNIVGHDFVSSVENEQAIRDFMLDTSTKNDWVLSEHDDEYAPEYNYYRVEYDNDFDETFSFSIKISGVSYVTYLKSMELNINGLNIECLVIGDNGEGVVLSDIIGTGLINSPWNLYIDNVIDLISFLKTERIRFKSDNNVVDLYAKDNGKVYKYSVGLGEQEIPSLINPYFDLTVATNKSVWDCSAGLNKTLSLSGDCELEFTNLLNGMGGILSLTISDEASLTFKAITGVTILTTGEFVTLPIAEYILGWSYTGTKLFINIKQYE